MADWYDDGKRLLISELASETGLTGLEVNQVYSWLVNEGFIDYDIEKELIFDRYGDRQEVD